MKEDNSKNIDIINQGRNLARFRKMRHWSQEELANKMGCTRNAIAGWEQSEELGEEVIKKIAEFFKIDPWYIECATDDDVFAKFADSKIGAVIEDGGNGQGIIAEDGGNVQQGVGVAEDGSSNDSENIVVEEGGTLEINKHPLDALIEAHSKETERLIEENRELKRQLKVSEELRFQELKELIERLKEENQQLKK